MRCDLYAIINGKGTLSVALLNYRSVRSKYPVASGIPYFSATLHSDGVSVICAPLQYYERTDTIVRQIKDILSADITSGENQEKLEEFKRDASAYGERSVVSYVTLRSDLLALTHRVAQIEHLFCALAS